MEIPSIYLNRILSEGAGAGATGLHLSVGNYPMIKVGGRYVKIDKESAVTAEILDKIINFFMSGEEQADLRSKKETVLIKDVGNMRLRINIFYQKNLPSFSFYFVSKNAAELENLGAPAILKDMAVAERGLLAVAGSYGSGKTATSAALIEYINKNFKRRIITVENPIEYLFAGKNSVIEQRQVGRDVNSATAGLKYCLEEDVDVVYAGEIKDDFDRAIPLALELASGNSLVILEINAHNTIAAVDKILSAAERSSNKEAVRYNLADILIGIIAQKLIPKIGGGLALACEIMVASPAVQSLIREGKPHQLLSVIQTSRKDGMISMDKAVEELIQAGKIRGEDVR